MQSEAKNLCAAQWRMRGTWCNELGERRQKMGRVGWPLVPLEAVATAWLAGITAPTTSSGTVQRFQLSNTLRIACSPIKANSC